MRKGASWVVAEGAETVKGATTIPLDKALDDCMVCYGQNGEAVRPQQGFPLRLLVPGFEGIHNIKYLRRIKVVDQYYMTYNYYGHINADARVAALGTQLGPKSIITFPSGGQLCLAGILRNHRFGVVGWWRDQEAWKYPPDGGQTWKAAEFKSPSYPMAHTRFGYNWKWDGKECVLLSRSTDELGTVQPTRADIAKYWSKPIDNNSVIPGADKSVFPWKIASDGSVHNGLA